MVVSQFSKLNGAGATYVDRPEPSAVTRGHVLVEGLDCVAAGHLAVLLVHVVGAGARVVADPDTESLDLLRAGLGDLCRCQDISQSSLSRSQRTLFKLTISPLAFLTLRSLLQTLSLNVTLVLFCSALPQEVPETALRDDIVGRKDPHAHQLRVLVGGRGQMAPNDLVFLQTACWATGQRAVLQKVVQCSAFKPIARIFSDAHLFMHSSPLRQVRVRRSREVSLWRKSTWREGSIDSAVLERSYPSIQDVSTISVCTIAFTYCD